MAKYRYKKTSRRSQPLDSPRLCALQYAGYLRKQAIYACNTPFLLHGNTNTSDLFSMPQFVGNFIIWQPMTSCDLTSLVHDEYAALKVDQSRGAWLSRGICFAPPVSMADCLQYQNLRPARWQEAVVCDDRRQSARER